MRPATRKSICENLEQRHLFSASPVESLILEADMDASDLQYEAIDADASSSADESPAGTGAAARDFELIIIDGAVENAQQLTDDIVANRVDGEFEIVILDATRDGIDQITDILATRSGVSAVHLVSHGDEGVVNLGNTQLSLDSLDAVAGDLAGWQDAFTSDGDLLIYGCIWPGRKMVLR